MEETQAASAIPGDDKMEEAMATKAAAPQWSATSIYMVRMGGGNIPIRVTVVWSKTLINHCLCISIHNGRESSSDPIYSCKVDLKPWPFWGKKGFKSLDIGDRHVDIFWDLRSAKFAGGGVPEPTGSYYVAMIGGEEVALLLGDLKKEAYRRTRARPSLDDPELVLKRDNVVGKRSFSSKARLGAGRREHEVTVESSIAGGSSRDGEMRVSIDGAVVILVRNLQWKFRGNETVIVEGSPVQVFWDVHDWLFGWAGTGQANFIFKPGSPPSDLSPEFCYFLCAWKVD